MSCSKILNTQNILNKNAAKILKINEIQKNYFTRTINHDHHLLRLRPRNPRARFLPTRGAGDEGAGGRDDDSITEAFPKEFPQGKVSDSVLVALC
jgi:hypothetical protein